jgi:hypothetical protein
MAKNKRQSRGSASLPAVKSVTEIPSDFNPDYSYVGKDLKRIGLLAGTFFVVLVIIAIVMPLLGSS